MTRKAMSDGVTVDCVATMTLDGETFGEPISFRARITPETDGTAFEIDRDLIFPMWEKAGDAKVEIATRDGAVLRKYEPLVAVPCQQFTIVRSKWREEKIAALRAALHPEVGDAIHSLDVDAVLDALDRAGFDIAPIPSPPIHPHFKAWGTFCGPWSAAEWKYLPHALKVRWWQETDYSKLAPTEALCEAVEEALKR